VEERVSSVRSKSLHVSAALAALTIIIAAAACGGGGNARSSGSPSTAPVTVNIGDAVAGLVSFEATVTNITLTGSTGTTTLLNTPVRLELTHLAGTFQPVAVTSVPVGSYNQLSITVTSAEATVFSGTQLVNVSVPSAGTSFTVALNPPLTISGGANTLNIDFNLTSSLSIDSFLNITFTPQFLVTAAVVPAAAQQGSGSGQFDLGGVVQSVSGTQFTMTVDAGSLSNTGTGPQTLTFNTNSSTTFDGVAGLSAALQGLVVEVDAITQSDGTFLARKIEVESASPNGMEVEGFITAVSGTPPSSFQLVPQEVSASAAIGPVLGSSVILTINPGPSPTSFRIGQNNVSLNGILPVPTFGSANDLAAGQQVEADSNVASGSNFTPTRVQLKEQALDGTISALTGSTFTLTLDPASAFAKASGKSTITVNGLNAQNQTGKTLANGQAVRVRGLLFFNSSASSYTMIPSQVQNQ
jgi:Domain of unknown function (DUF5666)/Domain of unknown function (DUF4382)